MVQQRVKKCHGSISDKLNESRTVLTTMYETENDLVNETTTGTITQATTSCNSLMAVRPVLKPVTSLNTHVDLDILRSSMTGDASQVCAFGTGLYEAKPRRKASFKIDASQAGLFDDVHQLINSSVIECRSRSTSGWSVFFSRAVRTACHQAYHAIVTWLHL